MDEIYNSGNRLTFHILLNSAAKHLNILRFELRVLRFFNDVCVPHMTFGVNKRQDRVWREVLPKHFLRSSLVRQAVFANGCLTLWAFADLKTIADMDASDDAALQQLYDEGVGDLVPIFSDMRIFEENEESNVFLRTATYYSEALAESVAAIAELQSPKFHEEKAEVRLEKVISITLSSSLVFVFLAMHPHRVVPLVLFDENTDLLHIVSGLRTVVLYYLEPLRASDIGETLRNDEFALVPKKKVALVEELRKQMNDYYAAASFLEIDAEMSDGIQILAGALDCLEKALVVSVRFNYPVMLFRWLTLISENFGALVRRKDYFAVRLLFVYSCLCLYAKFWLHEE